MTFSPGKPPCTCSHERSYLMLIWGRHYEGCRIVRKRLGVGVLVVVALFGAPALGAVGGPPEPVPEGLEQVVRVIDQALKNGGGDTRQYISDLLHLAKKGESSALERLRGTPNGVLCFWLSNLITFAEGALGDGVVALRPVVDSLNVLYGQGCRGPGGTAAEEQRQRIFSMFTGALNDLRVAEAVRRTLKGSPYQHLSPQAMHALPAGPPVPGAANVQMVFGALIVALTAGVAAPAVGAVAAADTLTWPALVAAMAGAQ